MQNNLNTSGLELGRFARRKDLTGQKFGKLTVLEMLYGYRKKPSGQPVTYCRCRCDCGTIVVRQASKLKVSATPSCGCANKEIVRQSCGVDVTGQKFGRLLVLDVLWDETPTKVHCLCDCGREKVIVKRDVISGHTKSCGCYHRDVCSEVNYKDITDKTNQYGVKAIRPSHQTSQGVWLWEFLCHCGNTFVGLPAKVFSETRPTQSCGCTLRSAREILIESFLLEIGANYDTQVKFFDCRLEYVLRFDFGIYSYDDELLMLVEYDGKQHYEPIDYFGGQEGFEQTILRDRIKDEYCLQNNILLHRIPYYYTDSEVKTFISNIIYA